MASTSCSVGSTASARAPEKLRTPEPTKRTGARRCATMHDDARHSSAPDQSDVCTQSEVGLSATHLLVPEQVWQAPQSASPVQLPPTHVLVVASQVSPVPVQSAAWVATVQ